MLFKRKKSKKVVNNEKQVQSEKTKEVELVSITKNIVDEEEKNENVNHNTSNNITLEYLKEIAKNMEIKNIQNYNKFELIVITWNHMKKDELLLLAKSQFKIDKTSTMNKEELISSIISTKTVNLIKELAKKLNVSGYTSAKTKDELIKFIVSANFKEILG